MTEKSLDVKLRKLRRDLHCGEFILADAKDADMARGIGSPGVRRGARAGAPANRSLAEYRESMREVVRQGRVDILLMSVHSSAILTLQERLFEGSRVTPAIRANDTTDIHLPRGGAYGRQAARPFRTALVDHAQAGKLDPTAEERARGANLGLYSVTFNNDVERDLATLTAYREFREEAERKGFRHFLEVFDPNAPVHAIARDEVGGYVNDMIVRTLAGVPDSARPLFLKLEYHGPRYMEELVQYDPTLIVGILGGAAGTTYDAFKLVAEAQKYGARAALFGRKINAAEDPLSFIAMLRRIVEGQITAEEAVRAYHGTLESLHMQPLRTLEEDMQLTEAVLRVE